MKVPVGLKIIALMLGATAFYTYVGQLVPQKEVYPPEELELPEEMSPEEMIRTGQQIFEGKGLCTTCHTFGKSGPLRFPDLAGIGSRAENRIPGLSGVEYIIQSMLEPDSFIVSGFNPGMPVINKPPIGLTDQEILTVVAYLQSQGGTVTVGMETDLRNPRGGLAGTIAGTAAGPAVSHDLAARLNCTSCHYLDRPGTLKAPSLYDIGSRLNSPAIMAAILAPRQGHQGSEFNQSATITEVRQVAEELAQRKGEQ